MGDHRRSRDSIRRCDDVQPVVEAGAAARTSAGQRTATRRRTAGEGTARKRATGEGTAAIGTANATRTRTLPRTRVPAPVRYLLREASEIRGDEGRRVPISANQRPRGCGGDLAS